MTQCTRKRFEQLLKCELRCMKEDSEIKRLRAIVNQYPKTGDNAPITIGMKLWYLQGDHIRSFSAYGVDVVVAYDSDRLRVRHADCYAAREALVAAKGGL